MAYKSQDNTQNLIKEPVFSNHRLKLQANCRPIALLALSYYYSIVTSLKGSIVGLVYLGANYKIL